MNKSLLLILASFTAGAFAAPISFDFKDPKGVNTIQFKLDAPLEQIAGTTNGISGTVTFDPAAPEATAGTILVDAKSLTVPNKMMSEHIQGERWLDTAKNDKITFELAGLSDVKASGANYTATAKGKLTLKGVTKEISVPVKLSYLEGAFGQRINKPELKGDLLVVRGNFTVLRTDFGINPGNMEDKVSNEISLSLALAGGAPQS
jgi:Uncharacterized conserved protein